MFAIAPGKIREKLTTDFGRAAFDRLDSLKPEWYCLQEGAKIYVSPAIDIRTSSSRLYFSLGTWTRNLDDALLRQFNELILKASAENSYITVNLYQENSASYLYSRHMRRFLPYNPA